MDQQQRSLRLGAALIACALVLRLGEAGVFRSLADFLTKPNISSLILYLETGRIVRFSPSEGDYPVFSLESALPDFAREKAALPRFAPEDAESIRIRYNCTRNADLSALLTRPLDWDLTIPEPTVLILHTHTTESYTPAEGEDYTESAAFRTLDERYNMLSLGDRLAELLAQGGITALQDRQLHDYPSYNGSYSHARKSIRSYLEQYPSIRLILDLHRDASGNNRSQMQTAAQVAGRDRARLMLVVGAGTEGPVWEDNLALALKLYRQLEVEFPGVMRYVNLRAQRFNQDLAPGMLLVEVGAAGDSHDQALAAVDALAQGILALKNGTQSS